MAVAARDIEGEPYRVIDAEVDLHLVRACHDPAHVFEVVEREEGTGPHRVERDELVFAERELMWSVSPSASM